jgi:hypothetical protein
MVKVLEGIASDQGYRGFMKWVKYADKLDNCGYLVSVKACSGCQYLGGFSSARSCGFKLCMFHQKRASAEKRVKIKTAIGLMKKPRFVTFTVKHGRNDRLHGTLEKLNKGWEKLLRRKAWRAKAGNGIASLETGWHWDNGWHPHLHVIFDGEYFPQKELRALWHEVTGDSYVVDVRAVDKGVINEMSKYLAKPSSFLYEFDRVGKQYFLQKDGKGEPVKLPFDVQKALVKEFMETMHRRRTLKVFGSKEWKQKLSALLKEDAEGEPEEEKCPNCQIEMFLRVIMPIKEAVALYKAQEELELEIRGPPGQKAA